VSNYHTNNL